MFRFLWFVGGAACLAALAGCGGSGGGGGNGTVSTPSQAATIGNASLKFQGKLQSKVGISSGSVSVAGASGASITEFNYSPAQVLANSSILYFDGVNELGIYSNGSANTITGATGAFFDYCFTQYGQIVFTMSDPATGYYQIFSCYEDGSGLTRITSNAENHFSVSVATGNTAIAFGTGSVLKTCNFTGGNEQPLGVSGDLVRYSPDGKQILYSSSSNQGLYLIPAAGGAAVAFDSALTSGNNIATCGWSPDQSKIICVINGIIYVCDSRNNGAYFAVSQGSGSDTYASIGPDSKSLCYSTAITSGTNSLIVSALDGSNQTANLTSATNYPFTAPVWSPYLGSKSFAGTSGSFYPTASGFLWTERGSAFSSLLCFTATTPSTATLTPETTGTANASLIFDCHADNITGVKYTNNYYVPPVSVTPNVSDFLVSFDATTGGATTIAPFVKASSTRKLVGNVATYTGKFPAIYDGKGKNLASAGATTLSLDTTTGKLLTCR